MWPSALTWTSPARETPSPEARSNVVEALQLFFETAPSEEVQHWPASEIFSAQVEINVA